jgi:toxin-antitoxin system PIN domain toxin
VTILDANILLYAYNADAPQNATAAEWLDRLIGGSETIGLPWPTIWAFLRIGTNSRIWPAPMEAAQALAIVDSWLGQPGVVVVAPGPRHLKILKRLVSTGAATGPLVTDAVLAALAIEHGAVLASTDRDFRRFPDLRWVDPLAAGL